MKTAVLRLFWLLNSPKHCSAALTTNCSIICMCILEVSGTHPQVHAHGSVAIKVSHHEAACFILIVLHRFTSPSVLAATYRKTISNNSLTRQPFHDTNTSLNDCLTSSFFWTYILTLSPQEQQLLQPGSIRCQKLLTSDQMQRFQGRELLAKKGKRCGTHHSFF